MSILADLLAKATAFAERAPLVQLDLATKAAPPVGSGSYGGFGGPARSDSFGWARPTLPRRSEVDYASVDAMGSSIVMACINTVTRAFPEARLRVMRRDTQGGSEEVPEHPLSLLAVTPNEEMSSDEFWQSTITDYSRGNAYWWKVRDARRRVVELWPLPRQFVRARWPLDASEWISYYELWTGRGWMRIETEDIVHFKNGLDPAPGSYQRYGLDPLRSVMREIYTDDEAASYTSTLLRNQGVAGAVFTPKETVTLTPDDVKAVVAAYQQAYTGDGRGRALLMHVPMDIGKLGVNPKDLDLTALRRISEERISALLNVPAIVAGLGAGLDRATYANYLSALQQLWTGNIRPTQRAIVAKLDADLLPDFGPAAGLWVDFDRSQIQALQENTDAVHTRVREDFAGGVISHWVAQRLLGLPVDETTPDYYLIPSRAVPVNVGSDPIESIVAARGSATAAPGALAGTAPGAVEPLRAVAGLSSAGRKQLTDGAPDAADLDRADAFWQAHADRRYRRLLEAKEAAR